MKKIILSVCCLITAAMANAQSPTFEWAKQMGGFGQDFGQSIAVDASGNIYTTGYFAGTKDFDPGPGTFNLIASGTSYNIFISKLDASGNFVWAKNMGGTNYPTYGYSIAVDVLGNVYTTGYFYGTTDFDPGGGTYNLASIGQGDIFISKLDGSGNFVWAKNMGGTSSVIKGYSIAIDLSGNIYTTGQFSGTCDFDPGASAFILTVDTLYDIFISKLNSLGNFVWAKKMGGSEFEVAQSITSDAFGNVYTTGVFQGIADFDPGTGTYNLTSAGTNDVFISKLNSSGDFVWAKNVGGASLDEGYSISVDASGNVYSTGRFDLTADFDPGPGTFNLICAGGGWDIFISKLNAAGNFVWAKSMGGSGLDQGYALDLDTLGNVYTTGIFSGTADFDPGAGVFNLTSAGIYDIFISKLDASGNLVWTKKTGGPGHDWGKSIAVDAAGNIYTTGTFSGTVDFDPDAGTFNLISGWGDDDIFVHKMSQCTAAPSATIVPNGTISFCSGGNILLNANTGAGLSYQWKLNSADIAGATNSSYTVTTAGSYTVVVTNLCGSATSSATTVTVNPLPSATIIPAGPTTFCSGSSVILNAPVAANRTYQWKKGANLISGATLSSYTATSGGNYKIIVTNTVTGCSKTTGIATVVTVNALPSATITPQGPTTFCAGGSVVLKANTGTGLTYKWKKGSNFISGATLLNYTATTGGNYKVQVTNSNGCSKTSAGVVVSVPCREGEIITSENIPIAIGIDLNVYPNPNSGEFTIKFSDKPAYPIQIELTDEIGKVVKRFEVNNETVVLKVTNLAKGIYCLIARSKDEMMIKKISVVK